MKYTIMPLTALFTSFCCTPSAMAQQDTTRLDIGYLTLNSAFTQQISIKGVDLEMMPFTNLSDAIRAWLYGAYTVPTTLQYVVDGNPVTDVNAYSIHDIDEVILVQNAAATVATAPNQEELVIIKTKRRHGPRGICASAQTGLVTTDKSMYSSTTALFHNYYLGAYRNLEKISFGVSGNYIRDVFPYERLGEHIITADNLARWRLNGYFDWRPDNHNRIELTMNYTPQKWNGEQDSSAQNASSGSLNGSYAALQTGHQHFVLPHLDWQASWGNGWRNHLQGTYVHAATTDENVTVIDETQGWQAQIDAENTKSYQVWLLDRIGFEAKLGNWRIEPSLNLSYQRFRNEVAAVIGSGVIVTSLMENLSNYASLSNLFAEETSTVWLLTPMVSFSYKQVLNLEGGAIVHPGSSVSLTANGREVYPFASAALDLLRLSGKPEGNSLKIYGSVVSRTQPSVNEYALADYSSGLDVSFILPNISFTAGSVGFTTGNVTPAPVYWTWDAGAGYSGWKGRLQIGYNFEDRISSVLGFGTALFGLQPVGIGKLSSSLHHLDIRVKVVDGPGVSWLTGLNVTVLRNQLEFQGTVGAIYPPVGDNVSNPVTWTGGWVNRLQVKDLSVGLDLLYHIQEWDIYGKRNVATTPNIYAGYRFRLPGAVTVQVFAETRGMFVNAYSELADARQYYTVGANLCL